MVIASRKSFLFAGRLEGRRAGLAKALDTVNTNQPLRRWILALIILAAVLLRALVAWRHPLMLPDSFDYETLARQILRGGPYEVTGMLAKRMPGYPVFLAGVYALFGVRPLAALLVQAGLGGILVGVVYAMGRRLSPAAGVVAAALVAVDPLLIGFAAALLSETVFTVVFTLALWLLLELLQSPGHLRRWMLVGVSFLAGVYIRAEVVLCLVPLVAWVAATGERPGTRRRGSTSARGDGHSAPAQPTGQAQKEKTRREDTKDDRKKHGTTLDPGDSEWAVGGAEMRRYGEGTSQRGQRNGKIQNSERWPAARPWLGAGAALLIVGAGLMPWWIRNYQLFGQDFFRFTTLQGISLYEAVYSGATGGPRQTHIALPAAWRGFNESQRDLAWTRRAWRAIRRHPGRVIWLAAVKIARTWSPWLHARGFARPAVNVPLTIWYILIYILFIVGLVRGGVPWRLAGVGWLSLLYFTMMHALFLGSVRYRVPVMPLVLLGAAVGACRLAGHPRFGANAGTQAPVRAGPPHPGR